MARKKPRAGAGPTGSSRTSPPRGAKPVRQVRRRPLARSAVKAIEEVRRAPLEPELPVNAAQIAALDPDAVEVLNETQRLADDRERADKERAAALSGGDVDAAWDQADVGEETVGGSAPTPDQDIVDDLGRAVGVTYGGTEPLRTEDEVTRRDEKRWEDDPASSEDYAERQRALRRRRGKRRS
jgi:uncharacterized protein DUF6335